MNLLAIMLALTASSVPLPLKSRAVPDIQTISAPRTPDDGDDIVTDVSKARKEASTYGALGRTVSNTYGIVPGSIVVKTSERRLYFGVDRDHVRIYPVAVGKAGAQWKGAAVIGRKAVNPTWYPTRRQQRLKGVPGVVRPGAHNPLGVRALYLSRDGRETLYRIHGTNSPRSIGKFVSSGCIRMRNADIVDLYRRVPVGTRVLVK